MVTYQIQIKDDAHNWHILMDYSNNPLDFLCISNAQYIIAQHANWTHKELTNYRLVSSEGEYINIK